MLKRCGFTLIELLIVMGIIALLLSILMPAVSRVRFNAKCAQCAANVRQLSTAMATYAADNDGWLPQTPRPGAANAYDVTPQFCSLLTDVYQIPKTSMLCPFQDDGIVAMMAAINIQTGFGYVTWIPLPCLSSTPGSGILSPPLIPGSSPFTYPMPLDPTPFAGPQRLKDLTAKDNPIITDLVTSNTAPSTARGSDVGNPYGITGYSNHQWGGRLENINAAFADGHVEAVMSDAVRPRYSSSVLCWR